MKSIKAKILANGQVIFDLSGFHGQECYEELEKIQKLILSFGIMIEQDKIQFKDSQGITGEIKTPQIGKEKIKTKRK
ncbi:MAG: hypothetical protein QXX08_06895 [Candidatus Bathyarchaeia archaeon]